jgi:hypothetical protein
MLPETAASALVWAGQALLLVFRFFIVDIASKA